MQRRVNSSPSELPRYVDKVRAFCRRASFDTMQSHISRSYAGARDAAGKPSCHAERDRGSYADQSLHTTKLYDCTDDEITLDEVGADHDLRRGSQVDSRLPGRQAKNGAGHLRPQAIGVVQPPLAGSLYSASLTCSPQAAPWPCSPTSDSARCENRRSGEAPCQCIVSGGMLTVSPGFSTWGFSPLAAGHPMRS